MNTMLHCSRLQAASLVACENNALCILQPYTLSLQFFFVEIFSFTFFLAEFFLLMAIALIEPSNSFSDLANANLSSGTEDA